VEGKKLKILGSRYEQFPEEVVDDFTKLGHKAEA
jgi:hypothetical protein